MERSLWTSTLVILWWVGVWGIMDWVVHHVSGAKPFRKLAMYLALLLLVGGTLYLKPEMESHF